MRILFDTPLLLAAAAGGRLLPPAARAALEAARTRPVFSAVSLWEIAILQREGRGGFQVSPHEFRRGLLENGYDELPLDGRHALAAAALPPLHDEPFGRILVAQAQVEEIRLVTADPALARYDAPVELAR
ncbi:type II toxin-antitoxin system VapC family toxin [Rhodobacteraceae bacterium DSL-40]|uniref:type II toxin-antitoxin system VapC family toxin n=1 Tax=Amaricoccus sp. B4 TaxID=3368557 RepID=UPI000DAD490B